MCTVQSSSQFLKQPQDLPRAREGSSEIQNIGSCIVNVQVSVHRKLSMVLFRYFKVFGCVIFMVQSYCSKWNRCVQSIQPRVRLWLGEGAVGVNQNQGVERAALLIFRKSSICTLVSSEMILDVWMGSMSCSVDILKASKRFPKIKHVLLVNP